VEAPYTDAWWTGYVIPNTGTSGDGEAPVEVRRCKLNPVALVDAGRNPC